MLRSVIFRPILAVGPFITIFLSGNMMFIPSRGSYANDSASFKLGFPCYDMQDMESVAANASMFYMTVSNKVKVFQNQKLAQFHHCGQPLLLTPRGLPKLEVSNTQPSLCGRCPYCQQTLDRIPDKIVLQTVLSDLQWQLWLVNRYRPPIFGTRSSSKYTSSRSKATPSQAHRIFKAGQALF